MGANHLFEIKGDQLIHPHLLVNTQLADAGHHLLNVEDCAHFEAGRKVFTRQEFIDRLGLAL